MTHVDSVTVRLAGQFDVRTADGRLLLPRGRKSRALLAYLLFQRGKPVSRSRLADLFWSDRDTEQARASLRQALYEIRKALGDAAFQRLSARRETVAIAPKSMAFDLWDAGDEYHPAAESLFLEDLDDVSPVFDDWVAEMRRTIRAEQLKKGEALLHGALQGGQADAIAAAATTVLALDGTNEPAARRLIEALGQLGRPSSAKAEFEKLRQALEQDGFEVEAQTREVLAAALDRSEAAGPAAQRVPVGPVSRASALPTLTLRVPQGDDGAGTGQLARNMEEVLSHRLERMTELSVVAGPSADFELEVSAQPRADRVLCIVRLTDRRSGVLCWSMRETLLAERVVEQMDDHSAHAAGAILAAIERIEIQMADGRSPETSTAYDHYLRAKFRFFEADGSDYMAEVQEELEAALAKDPDFVAAYPHLIQSHNTSTFYTRPGLPQAEGRARALELAERLLSIDSRQANGHIAMGWCLLWRRNFAAAERSIETALQIGTDEAHRINSIGTALVYLGRHEEGEGCYNLAQERMVHELDYQRTDYGELFYLKGDYDQALSWLDFGERRTRYRTLFWRALTLAQLGRLAEASADLERLNADIAEKWAGGRPCATGDPVRWVLSLVPLRRDEDNARVIDGLERLGAAW
ncbi:BTAD domain-containing putative transcriptional regulator [Histidinibacterium aquaticum]|uniref:Bacterial transcriptional activator domain-containing protein n=1 Tax=Histidinibacterium aquaticum TaxID=2613962 RepID=A0A5J5GPW7_9RHOB|nr:BTAD domain-containing putative transcriptional regulator [Histidinibacterium aquaticum]KAA9009482.1 hypothetical protein F3S47_09590 [Histidinibacterium aquaticum]